MSNAVSALPESAWNNLANLYAFAGNSFLSPMTRENAIGITANFWEAMPHFNNGIIQQAQTNLAEYANQAQCELKQGANVIQKCAVEYTHLYIGPPRPAAPPWETMYMPGNESIGFGAATVDMKRRIAAEGLTLGGVHNQYEDHIGIELLLLSVLCKKQAQAKRSGVLPESTQGEEQLISYIKQRPGCWIGKFTAKTTLAAPSSYYALLATWVQAVIGWHSKAIGNKPQNH